MIPGVWAIVVSIGSAVVALFAVWFSAKKSGKAEANVAAAEQRTAEHEALAVDQIQKAQTASKTEIQSVSNANEAINEVNAMSDADVMRELRNEYSRPEADSSGNGEK